MSFLVCLYALQESFLFLQKKKKCQTCKDTVKTVYMLVVVKRG